MDQNSNQQLKSSGAGAQATWSRAWISIAAILLGVLTVSSLFEDGDWLPALLSWFRFEYLVGLLVLAILFVKWRRPLLAVWCTLFLLVNASAILPYFIPGPSNNGSGNRLVLCQINVNRQNKEYDKIAHYIRKHAPDVVLIEEVTDTWADALRSRLPEFDNWQIVTRPDAFGLAIGSKLPLKDGKIREYAGIESPQLVSSINWHGKEIQLIHLHTTPMYSNGHLAIQHNQLKEAGLEASAMSDYKLIAGDINAPIWNTSMRKLQNQCHVRSAACGFGWQPTWPRMFQRFFGQECPIDHPAFTTIDHCLVGEKWLVRKFEVGEYLGSDHSPLYVELEEKR